MGTTIDSFLRQRSPDLAKTERPHLAAGRMRRMARTASAGRWILLDEALLSLC